MRKWCALMTVVLCAMWCTSAMGDYFDDFEGYNSAPGGVDLNGQGNPPWYNPVNPGLNSAKVYDYSGNTLGFPANCPTGGNQFVGARGPGNAVFLRSQKDFPYPVAGKVKVAVDTAANHDGVVPRTNNLGSFSVQVFGPPHQRGAHIQLATFTDINTATTWDADYVWFTAANAQVQEKITANPNFQGLALNHWYRRWTTIDMDTNAIVEVGIMDLTTCEAFTYAPAPPNDRYGAGGPGGGGLLPPTGGRLFGGTTPLAGNTMAFDNLFVGPPEDDPPCEPCPPPEKTCQYKLKKSKAKGGCDTCPATGDCAYDSGDACDSPGACTKKVKGKIPCPGPEGGSCTIKGKRCDCA